jgi:hypothetical protein
VTVQVSYAVLELRPTVSVTIAVPAAGASAAGIPLEPGSLAVSWAELSIRPVAEVDVRVPISTASGSALVPVIVSTRMRPSSGGPARPFVIPRWPRVQVVGRCMFTMGGRAHLRVNETGVIVGRGVALGDEDVGFPDEDELLVALLA